MRIGENEIIATPTGISKSFITPDKLVTVDMEGNILEANEGYRPSSELKMHICCYKEREDVKAVVHAHPIAATAFAVAHKAMDMYVTLSTSGQYKTVLVVNENADIQNLAAGNIFYIDQAASSAEAFVNIGLKKGQDSKIPEGRYTMYLMSSNNTKTSRTIIVSDEPVEGEGVAFSAITGEDGKNPVREEGGKYYTDQGYSVALDANETPIKGYKLVISCDPEGGSTITYEVPQEKLTSLEGSGTFNIGLQINDIPCSSSGDLLATFTPLLIPLY